MADHGHKKRASTIKSSKDTIKRGFLPKGTTPKMEKVFFGSKKTTVKSRTRKVFVSGIKSPARAAEGELRRVKMLDKSFPDKGPPSKRKGKFRSALSSVARGLKQMKTIVVDRIKKK